METLYPQNSRMSVAMATLYHRITRMSVARAMFPAVARATGHCPSRTIMHTSVNG